MIEVTIKMTYEDARGTEEEKEIIESLKMYPSDKRRVEMMTHHFDIESVEISKRNPDLAEPGTEFTQEEGEPF